MGWTSYDAPTIYNPRTMRWEVDRKAECDKLWNCSMVEGRGKYEVLKSRMVGATYYAAVKMTKYATETEPEKTQVIAAVVLTSTNTKDHFNFSYKDMDETVGPYESNCPKSILDMLTPTDSEFANAWRQRCYENIKAKQNPDALHNLPLGTVIKATMPFDTRFYHKGDVVTLTKCINLSGKQKGWYSTRAKFTAQLMKALDGCYEIVKKGECK